jgi:hypothetical protein
MTDVVIQLPAYDEANIIADTMRAIREQPVPEGYTVTYEAWITRNEDKFGLCDTMVAADRVEGWDTFEAPQGKLSARNAAHDDALARGADIIVTWDADAPPLTEGTLTALVAPFEDDAVVAVNSVPVAAPEPDLIGRLTDLTGFALDRINPHIHGQCHAMTAAAWDRLGPFDDSIDQTESTTVRQIEEFGFYDRLTEIGTVVTADDAVVFNDTRRTRCRVPLLGDSEFCDRRSGAVTFRPFRRW